MILQKKKLQNAGYNNFTPWSIISDHNTGVKLPPGKKTVSQGVRLKLMQSLLINVINEST